MSRRAFIAVHAVIIVVTLLRVGSTHHVFSQTMDEPVHIAAGYDWLHRLPYDYDARNPPLPRVLAALPLLITRPPLSHYTDLATRGNELLYWGDHYKQTLSRTRWGN